MSRVRRSSLSLLTSVGSSFFSLCLGLFTTPLLLRWLGDERFGTYRVGLEWVSYVTLLDFGLSGALQAITAKRLGNGQYEEALAGIRQALPRFAWLGIIQLLVILGLAVTSSGIVKGINPDTISDLQSGLLLVCVGLLFAPFHSLRPLLDSAQQSYWVNFALFFQGIGITGFSLLFAWGGWGIVGQFAAFTLGSMIYAMILLGVVHSRYPSFWKRREKVESLPFIDWPMFIFNSCGKLSVLSDSIILGSLLGAPEVAMFYVTQRFFFIAQQQIMGIGNSSWAGMAELYHRNEQELLRRRFLELNRLSVVLSLAAFGPILVVNTSLVSLWVGPMHFGGASLSAVTCWQSLVMVLIALWCWPFAATGKLRLVLPTMVTGSLLNIIVSIVGTHYLGILGPALGTAIGYTVVYIPMFVYLLQREFGISQKQLIGDTLECVALFLPVGACLWVALPYTQIEDWSQLRWPRFIGYAGIASMTGVLYLLLAYRILLNHADRVIWVQRLRSPLKRFGLLKD
jgi:O-antigen/teichoic acid export membrane protein